jgi:hypothetical protein
VGFQPDSSTVLVDNLLANRQPDPVTGILGARMQAVKDGKNDFRVFWCDVDAVVGYRKHPFRLFPLRGYLNHGRLSAAKLDGVSDQVLKHLL